MAAFPDDLLYSREHTWARVDGNLVTIGITDYGQDKLGEILNVELPEVDTYVEQDEPFGTIESAKTVTELISPVSGDVVRVNDDMSDDVGIVNSDPYDTGWMVVVEMKEASELDSLLDASEYNDYVLGEEALD
jgi:glycine cleavage system H protein